MPAFDGTGPLGIGPMTGGARGFCNPWGVRAFYHAHRIYQGARYPFVFYQGAQFIPGVPPFIPVMTREQELDYLKNQARVVKSHLEQIEARIQKLESSA
jgi:hypothetical protein